MENRGSRQRRDVPGAGLEPDQRSKVNNLAESAKSPTFQRQMAPTKNDVGPAERSC